MKLNITDEQARQIMTNAINASISAGRGHLPALMIQREDKNYTVGEIVEASPGRTYLRFNFFRGRMVNLWLKKTEDGYELPDSAPDPDSHTWARKYPTYEALANSVMGSSLTQQPTQHQEEDGE